MIATEPKLTDLYQQVNWPPAGRYVAAVSGGVDSLALLDLLAGREGLELKVAHFHHGWSESADEYVHAVGAACRRYKLPLVIGRAKVAQNEAAAREVRYGFLRQVMKQTEAEAVITAHHRDDLIETVVLNLRRGTGRRGLTPFEATADVVRPLAGVTKSELINYAQDRKLAWVEDPTNLDTRFRRNKVRHELLPELRKTADFEAELGEIIEEAAALNRQVDRALLKLFGAEKGRAHGEISTMRRLPLATLAELLVMMARAAQPGAELDRRTVEDLAVDLKTGRFSRSRRLSRNLFARASRATVAIAFAP